MDLDIKKALTYFVALTLALTFHEFGHAFVADRLGDPTPRRHGRITLNPMVHFRAHPVGALIAPLVGPLIGFIFAWASTPVNPALVRRTVTVRKAEFLITFAGPFMNMILFVVSVAVWTGLQLTGNPALIPFVELAEACVFVNVILAVFNLFPIPPLDGFTILRTLFPNSGYFAFAQQYSMILFILVVMYGGRIFGPIFAQVSDLLRWTMVTFQ